MADEKSGFFAGVKSFMASRQMNKGINQPGSRDINMDELRAAGVVIEKGDPRLKKGFDFSGLSADEKAKVEAIRKKQFPGT